MTAIDLIYYGTPSPKMLEKFLSQYNIEAKKLDNIKFRTKGNFQISDNVIIPVLSEPPAAS